MCSFQRSFWELLAAVVLAETGLILPAPGQQSPPPADTPSPAAPPAITTGSVTLPYSELKTLWEAAQPKPAPLTIPKPPAPPVAFSVQSARYEIALGGDLRQATGQVVFDVLGFVEGWTAVPLLPVADVLLSALEPEDALVTILDGNYTLFLDHPGKRTVTLRFSVDLPEGGGAPGTRSLPLSGSSALVSELTVTGVPAGWSVEAHNAVRVPAGDDSAHFRLVSAQSLALTFLDAQTQKPALPPVPSAWQAEAQSLVRYDEGQLDYKTRLRLSADAGTGLTAELILPTAANVLSLTSADLDRWRVVKSDAAETRRLELTWKTPDTLRREILLAYEIPQAAPDGDWRLSSPQVAAGGGRLQSALYALPAMGGVELTSGEGSLLNAGDARQLPRWLAGEIAGGNFVALNADKPAPADNAAALVRVRRLPLLHTARATVEESHFRTRLVADGALLSEGTMNVRHDGPLTFSLTLPKDAQLLACSVDSHDALPVDRGGGHIDLTLPVETPGKTTQIDLSYTGHQPALAPVAGRTALVLPESDLFVQTLLWDLQIPEAYELTALEGNVALVPGGASKPDGPPVIRLRKDLLKGEQPSAELFYQKRAVTP